METDGYELKSIHGMVQEMYGEEYVGEYTGSTRGLTADYESTATGFCCTHSYSNLIW